MNRLLLSLPVLLIIFGINHAYAESSDDVNITVMEYDKSSSLATVQMTWNTGDAAAKYEVGCVSCMPNTSEFSSENSVTLYDVAPFPNASNAMLYLIAYDSQNEIIHAEADNSES